MELAMERAKPSLAVAQELKVAMIFLQASLVRVFALRV
jgi:hypothetical protein